MSLYDTLAASSARLLAKYGQPGMLRVTTTGVYDPTQGRAPVTTTDYSASMLPQDYPFRTAGLADGAGTLIQEGDKNILVSPTGVNGAALPAPQPGDVIIIGADQWTVKSAKTVSPGGLPLLYDLHGRT